MLCGMVLARMPRIILGKGMYCCLLALCRGVKYSCMLALAPKGWIVCVEMITICNSSRGGIQRFRKIRFAHFFVHVFSI